MGELYPVEPALLLCGLLWAEPAAYDEALTQLTRTWGPVHWQSAALPWQHSRYYSEELGEPIQRRFLTLGPPRSPEALPEIKLACNALELQLARPDGRRRINIDPGFITLANLILASTKPAAHRVPIGRQLYAEVTLVFEHNHFRRLPWTYADYGESAELFTAPRHDLKTELRRQRDAARNAPSAQ